MSGSGPLLARGSGFYWPKQTALLEKGPARALHTERITFRDIHFLTFIVPILYTHSRMCLPSGRCVMSFLETSRHRSHCIEPTQGEMVVMLLQATLSVSRLGRRATSVIERKKGIGDRSWLVLTSTGPAMVGLPLGNCVRLLEWR